jgi:hypothetical protein
VDIMVSFEEALEGLPGETHRYRPWLALRAALGPSSGRPPACTADLDK